MAPLRLIVSLFLNALVCAACSDGDPLSGARSTEEDPPAFGNPDAGDGAPLGGSVAPPLNPPMIPPLVDGGGPVIAPDENVCGVQDFDRQPRPAEVLLVLDRSGSMENELESGETRWEAIVPTLVSAIEATTAGIWWGLKSYPELDDTESCAPESIVPTIHVPIAEGSGGTVVTAVEATTPRRNANGRRHSLRHGSSTRARDADRQPKVPVARDGWRAELPR